MRNHYKIILLYAANPAEQGLTWGRYCIGTIQQILSRFIKKINRKQVKMTKYEVYVCMIKI